MEIFLFYKGPLAEQKHAPEGGRGCTLLPQMAPQNFTHVVPQTIQKKWQFRPPIDSKSSPHVVPTRPCKSTSIFTSKVDEKSSSKYTVAQSQLNKTTVFYGRLSHFVVCTSNSHNARKFSEILHQSIPISTWKPLKMCPKSIPTTFSICLAIQYSFALILSSRTVPKSVKN